MVYSEMSTDGSTGPFSLIMPHTRDMQGVRTGFKDRVRCIVIYEGWNFNFFFLLVLQLPMGVVFYSPLVGFSLLAYEVS